MPEEVTLLSAEKPFSLLPPGGALPYTSPLPRPSAGDPGTVDPLPNLEGSPLFLTLSSPASVLDVNLLSLLASSKPYLDGLLLSTLEIQQDKTNARCLH